MNKQNLEKDSARSGWARMLLRSLWYLLLLLLIIILFQGPEKGFRYLGL